MKKSLLLLLSALFLLAVRPVFAATHYVDNPSLCPTDAYSQSCVDGNKVCGLNSSNVVSCYNTDSLNAPSSNTSVSGGSVTTSGGYRVDCYAYDGSNPRCDNNGNFACFQKSSCNSLQQQTICTAGQWVNSTCGSCKPGYNNCDGNDANGCSGPTEHDGVSCTTASGAPGTYSNCECVGLVLKLGSDSVSGSNLIQGGSATAMFVNGSKVGVGTSNPSSIFHLYNTSANAEFDIQSVSGINNHWGIYNNSADNSLKFWGGDNRLTLLRNGNAIFGNTVSTGTASPLNVSFGGTYGSNTPGSVNNLKWDMFTNGSSGNRYGIGMSPNLMEFQAGSSGALGFFVNQGTEAMRILANGNVGIGTSSANQKLRVQGNVSATSFVGINNAAYYLNPESVGTGLNIAGSIVSSGSNNNTFAGNVGVGTTNPRARLEVNANDGIFAGIVTGNLVEVAGLSDVAQGAEVTITSGSLVDGGPTAKNGKGYWNITSFPATITLNTRGWWTYGGMSFVAANVHNYPNGGGSKLPANFLIEGSADGVNWSTVDNVTGYTSALYYKSNVSSGNGRWIRITATAPQSGETTAKLSNIQIFNSQRGGKNPFSLSAEGNAVFLGGNVGLGAIKPLAKLGVAGNAAIGDNYGLVAAPTSGLIVEGNVGIGTTNSGSKLTVYNGDIAMTNGKSILINNSTANTTLILGNYLNSNGLLSTFSYGTSTNSLNRTMSLAVEGDVKADRLCIEEDCKSAWSEIVIAGGGNQWITSGNNIYSSNSGNVGIGTNNPSQKLEVNGRIRATSGGEHVLISGSDTAYVGLILTRTQEASNSDWEIGIAGAAGQFSSTASQGDAINRYKNNYLFSNANTERMRLTASGNVGIGDSSPDNKLDVSGSIEAGTEASNSANIKIDIGNAGSPQISMSDTNGDNYWAIGADDSNNAFKIIGSTTGMNTINNLSNPYLTILSNGNVGINTSNPSQKLQVNGGVSASRFYGQNNNTYYLDPLSVGSGLIMKGSLTSEGTGNNTFAGNVGVGTTNPRGNLDIKGFYATNSFYGTSSWTGDPTTQFMALGKFYTDSNVKVILDLEGCSFGGTSLEYTINKGYGRTPRVYYMGPSNYGSAPAGMNERVTFKYKDIGNADYYLGVDIDGGCSNSSRSVTALMSVFGRVDFTELDNDSASYLALSPYQYIYNGYEGNVGIGTTTLTAKLNLGGGGIMFPDGTLQSTAFLGSSTQQVNAGNVSAGKFGDSTGGGNYSFPGFLGIGTASPALNLDVKGRAQIDNSNTYTTYKWTNSAVQTNSIEILDKVGGSTSDGVYPTLTFHDYGAGGAQFSMEGATKTLHLGSGNSNSAGTLQTGSNYFSKFKVWGNLEVDSSLVSDTLKYTRATNISSQDLNSITDAGFYSGNSLVNAPNTGWFYITVERYNGNASWAHQTATSFGSGNTGNRVYTRTLQNSTWSDWNEHVIANSNGNVGIGTTNPAAKLHVSETTGSVAGANSGSLIIDHENSGGASSITFRSKSNRGSDYGYIQYQDSSTVGAGGESARLILGTSNDGTDHIALMPSGNVGIGTTSPGNYKLNVNGNTNISGNLSVSGTLSGNSGVTSSINAANVSSGMFGTNLSTNPGNYTFSPNSNLGLGITPTSKLHIYDESLSNNSETDFITLEGHNGDVTDTPQSIGLKFYSHDGNSAAISTIRHATVNDTDYGQNDEDASNLIFATSDYNKVVSDKMIITGRGDIGIGTISPLAKLDIYNDNNYYAQTIAALNNIGIAFRMKSRGLNNSTLAVGAIGSADKIGFQAFESSNNTAKEIVFNPFGGNVGIGTTVPYAKLHSYDVVDGVFNGLVIDNRKAYGAGTGTNETSRLALSLSELSASVLSRVFGYMEAGTDSEYSSANGWLALGSRTNGSETEKLRISSSGNIGIGTTNTSAAKLVINGGTGVAIKATGDGVFTGTLQTQTGADFAEEFSTTKNIEAGTVVVMGDHGYKSVKTSTISNDKTVVGIVSNNPSIIAGHIDSEFKAVVAMMGVVEVKVTNEGGTIKRGDLLSTASLDGYAMKTDGSQVGIIIGKALENLNGSKGKINVLVNLQ